MTLKEKVAEMEPKKIGWHLCGGVVGCPSDYAYLNSDRNATNCYVPTLCTECWNREFVPVEDEGMKDELMDKPKKSGN